MPPERFPPDDPREWLSRARSNLIQALLEHPDVYLEDLCFQAQQAVEKALKALLLCRGIRFPPVHDLAVLIRSLERSGQIVPSRIREVVQLSDYAVEARYPGVGEPVTWQEYHDAVVLAGEVVSWVEENL